MWAGKHDDDNADNDDIKDDIINNDVDNDSGDNDSDDDDDVQPQHGGGGESERDPHHVGCGHRGPRGADRPLLQRVGLLPGLQVEWHVSRVTLEERLLGRE